MEKTGETSLGRAALTPREAEVLQHVIAGKSNKEIAEALSCALRTVECHVTSILRKRGVRTRFRLLASWVHTEAERLNG